MERKGSKDSKKSKDSKRSKREDEFEYGDEDSDFFDEEDEELGAEEEVQLESFGLVSLLTSRQFLLVLFMVDLLSAGYICGLTEDTEVLLIGVSAFFLLLYAVQFFLQLGFFIPYTLENNYRDFVWAAEVDGPSFVLFIVDICLVFLQFGVSDDVGLKQIMTLTIRVVRLIRVQLFFYKGSKAHRIRAESFLAAKNKIVMEYIKKMNEEAVFTTEQQQPQRQRPQKNWLASLQIPRENLSQLERNRDKMMRKRVPNRPMRPTDRRRGLSAVNRLSMGGITSKKSSNSGKHGSNRLSYGHNPLLDQQLHRYQQASKDSHSASQQTHSIGHKTSNRLSGRLTNIGGRLTNIGRPNRPANTDIYTAANGWHRYRNEKTGQMILYNKYTGKWVDAKDVEKARQMANARTTQSKPKPVSTINDSDI